MTQAEKTNELAPAEQNLPSAQAMNPMQMLSMAVEQGADIQKLEKLMDLQERWEANNARAAFDSAISGARSEIKPIVKTGSVNFTSGKGQTSYRHETLDGIAQQIDPILSSYGLSYRFRSRQEGQMLHVTCIVSHKDGHSEETELNGPPDQSGNKNSYQAIGSAATYLQRYTLKLALGLSAAKDDDASGVDDIKPQSKNPEPLTEYKKRQFDDNKKSWEAAIKNGRTSPEHIIVNIKTRYTLPDDIAGEIMKLG